MENQQYEILKYLKERGIPVHPDDLPHRIKAMFDRDVFSKGGYYHQMAYILCEHNKWLKTTHHGTDYFILDTDGEEALMAYEKEKETEMRQRNQDRLP
jgi:hypothetical protein